MKRHALPSWLRGARPALTATLLALSSLPARADNWEPNLTTTGAWNRNATNADQTADRIDALQLKAGLLAAQRYEYRRDDSLRLEGRLDGEWWPRFNGLATGGTGVTAEWQHKFGVDARAPAVVVGVDASAMAAKESGRRGVSTGFTVAVRKRLDDLTRAAISHEVSWMDARNAVFDSAASTTAVEIDRDLTDLTRLTFTAQYRDGDIVSYATPLRADLAALATRQSALDSFGRAMTGYRIDARSWSARLAFLRAVSEHSALVLAFEWRETRRGTLGFINTVATVAVVHQF